MDLYPIYVGTKIHIISRRTYAIPGKHIKKTYHMTG